MRRRYEILLPSRFNDGRSVLIQKTTALQETLLEIIRRYGAMSYNPNTVLGVYVKDGQEYQDDLYQLVIDVDDTEENRAFFRDFKARLAGRFQQMEIYMVTYLLEVV